MNIINLCLLRNHTIITEDEKFENQYFAIIFS
jgi:hypothetical protein